MTGGGLVEKNRGEKKSVQEEQGESGKSPSIGCKNGEDHFFLEGDNPGDETKRADIIGIPCPGERQDEVH